MELKKIVITKMMLELSKEEAGNIIHALQDTQHRFRVGGEALTVMPDILKKLEDTLNQKLEDTE